ncbi:cell division protein FtsA [Chloroflexota bacterium]
MAGTIACIDIGSSKICTVIANVAYRRVVEILGVGQAASRGVEKGIVVEIDDATADIRDSLEAAESAAGLGADRAFVGFSGKHIYSTNTVVSVDVARKDHLVTESDIEEADRKLESISFPENRVRVNVIRRQYALDNMDIAKNPLSMRGLRLDLEAHIVTADLDYKQNILTCLERAGVPFSSGSFVANPWASAEAVLEPEDKEKGAIVVDIGGGSTSIAVYREGSIWYTAALPVGGRQITSDLAACLNIPVTSAEELKMRVGTLYPEGEIQADTEVLERCGTSLDEVSYIIRARVEEILMMTRSRVPYMPDILVITGGTANLPGMDRFTQEVFGLQARVGVPRCLPEDPKGLDDPVYASVIGLLLLGSWMAGLRSNGHGRFLQLYSGLRSGLSTARFRVPGVNFGAAGLGESKDRILVPSRPVRE